VILRVFIEFDRIIPQDHARPHTASSKKLIEYYSNSILINQEFGVFEYVATSFTLILEIKF
jgi:hypothetical protein